MNRRGTRDALYPFRMINSGSGYCLEFAAQRSAAILHGTGVINQCSVDVVCYAPSSRLTRNDD